MTVIRSEVHNDPTTVVECPHLEEFQETQAGTATLSRVLEEEVMKIVLFD